MRSILLAALALLVSAQLAIADPNLHVSYIDGVPRVQIDGDYANTTYTVYRATRADGPYAAMTQHDILCLGTCFLDDRSALPDVEYFYRFDLLHSDGLLESFGPYPVKYSSTLLRVVATRAYPNPGTGPATIEFFVAGEAAQPGVRADASLFDAQGRRVRHLYRGMLPRGLTSLYWDGRDDAGRPLNAGLYFLRFETPLGRSVARVLRTR